MRIRKELWEEIKLLANFVKEAWCLGDDFNSSLILTNV